MTGKILRRISSGKRQMFALRMAPMIDIIFLLLIFFLVAAKWRPKEDFLPLRAAAAQANAGDIAKAEPLTIGINSTETGCQVRIGQLYVVKIEDREINENLALLAEKLKMSLLEQKRFAGDPVEIVCGPAVKWQYLTKIYNLFYGMGLTDITFVMTE